MRQPAPNVVTQRTQVADVGVPKECGFTLQAATYARAFRRRLISEFKAAGLPLTPSKAQVFILVGRNEGFVNCNWPNCFPESR